MGRATSDAHLSNLQLVANMHPMIVTMCSNAFLDHDLVSPC